MFNCFKYARLIFVKSVEAGRLVVKANFGTTNCIKKLDELNVIVGNCENKNHKKQHEKKKDIKYQPKRRKVEYRVLCLVKLIKGFDGYSSRQELLK